jgi:tyrosyl-tRNA synthetase
MQIGASDQWGNMLSGVPLIRKKENKEAHAFSMPLVINKQTGRKFGKAKKAQCGWILQKRHLLSFTSSGLTLMTKRRRLPKNLHSTKQRRN